MPQDSVAFPTDDQTFYQLFNDAFPDGTVRASDIPGMYVIDTGPRALRTPVRNVSMSQAKALEHRLQEIEDRQTKAQVLDDAHRCGAHVLGFERSKKLGVLVVRYRSRTGYLRVDSIKRAKATSWGQTRQHKGEALAVLTLQALCPADDWRQHVRPDFLEYNESGRKLELDGYSASLKLAIEYNGPHHYGPISKRAEHLDEHRRQVERDQIKRNLCRESGVTLIEMRHHDLDPDFFLDKLRELLLKVGISGLDGDPETLGTRKRWEKACDNPFAEFQAGVLHGLGKHVLVTPDPDKLTPQTILTYRCGACGQENEAIAKGFLQAGVRLYCPLCKAPHQGRTRQARTREVWIEQGVDRSVMAGLKHAKGKFVHVCDAGHTQEIASPASVIRHTREGRFVCPKCIEDQTGLHYSHAARADEYQQAFSSDIMTLGLSLVEFLPYVDKAARARVRCPHGHQYEITQKEASQLLKGSVRSDRTIVLSACPQCCYPGIVLDEVPKLATTVYHRLHVLRSMYPNVRYLDGFDPTGWGVERYACGEHYSDGTEHGPISVSFRGLQKAAERAPDHHLCIACAHNAGQVSGRWKKLDDVRHLVKAVRNAIDLKFSLPKPWSEPTVAWVSGPLSAQGDIKSAKTRLTIWCGVHGHAPKEATKDYYFNRAPNRGRGFCPQCVDLTGQKKASVPMELEPNGRQRLTAASFRETE